MNINVDKNVLAGKWKRVRGKVREEWGKLTKHDLERAKGRVEQLVGRVQEGYGSTRLRAKREVEGFVKQVKSKKQSRVKLK